MFAASERSDWIKNKGTEDALTFKHLELEFPSFK